MPPLDLSLLGLPRYEILWREGRFTLHVRYRGPIECPECGQQRLRTKDRFVRRVRHVNSTMRRCFLEIPARKFRCLSCGRTFHQRFPGLLPRRRYTEAFRRQIVRAHRDGISQKTLARQEGLGVGDDRAVDPRTVGS